MFSNLRVFHFWKGDDDVRGCPKCFQHDILKHGVHSRTAFHAKGAVHEDTKNVTTC